MFYYNQVINLPSCHPVSISSTTWLWTNCNSAAAFIITCRVSIHLFTYHKTVISHSQLRCGSHADANWQLLLLVYCFGTVYWGLITPPGRFCSVPFLQAGVQPTLDPCAEAFCKQAHRTAQDGRSLVNDVCECMHDWRPGKGWVGVSSFFRYL